MVQSRWAVAALALLLSQPALAGHGSHHGYGSSHGSYHHSGPSHSSSHHSHGGAHGSSRSSRTDGWDSHPSGVVRRDAHGRIERSPAAKKAFRRDHPCPSTGRTSGRCPGYEVDHRTPLACGGADAPSNMQWLTTEENRRKGSEGCRRR